MARGRLISNEITRDKRINDLSDDTSRLAFTWLITFADCEGRTYGDPALVRSMLFPRRIDITVEKMTEYIHEWQDAGLIVWYEANGDLFICFPAFDKHQVGLRKDRETPSAIPQPLQSNSGVTPEKIGLSLSKVKLKEVEVEPTKATPFQKLLYAYFSSANLPIVNPSQRDVESLNRLLQAGVTVEDVKNGTQELIAKNYHMRGPSSIENAAIFARNKRMNGAKQEHQDIAAEEY